MSDAYYDKTLTQRQLQIAQTPDMVAQRALVLSMLDLNPGEHVLELGSGNGVMAQEMAERLGPSSRITGVDASDVMVAMARNLCPSGDFVEGDASAPGVPNESVDAAVAMQVLCYLPDLDKTLKNLHRALKPGGRAVLLDTDWGSLIWNARDEALMARAVARITAGYANAHTPRILSSKLQSAGFRIVERRVHPVVAWRKDSEAFAEQVAGHVVESLAGDWTAEDAARWRADLDAMDAAGTYLFSLNRYVFRVMRD